jgi:BirA family biotin operon repressor/biotin-[acetyl-CoA-carboxylase] ligase
LLCVYHAGQDCRDQNNVPDRGGGLGLIPHTDGLSAETIRAGLRTGLLGRRIVFLDETTSTNDEARRMAEAGAPEGTLVVSDYQSAGRGRLGRHWQSPRGSCLLVSVVFRPALPPDWVQRLTMMGGLAVVDAVEQQTGVSVGLKWPNDIMVGRKKLGGILTEVGLTRNHVDHVVVGIGLNVNLDPEVLTGTLIAPATSLSAELGREVSRLPVLLTLIQALEVRYLESMRGEGLVNAWRQRLVTIGQSVAVTLPDCVLRGVAEGVDDRGALLLRTVDGQLIPVLAGDVTGRT